MHIITLTSDWNNDDYYVASLKGKLISRCPKIRIVDLSHKVKPFKSAEAAFLVRNSFRSFPKGSIHIIAVNTEPLKGRELLAAFVDGHYFVCADNGIIGMLGAEPEQVIVIPTKKEQQASTFTAVSHFADIACSLAEGSALDELGIPSDTHEIPAPLKPTIGDHTITGSVRYIDTYENAITNISKEFFERTCKGRSFKIFVQSKHYVLDTISEKYNESPDGELLAIFNSLGLLEIAIRNGNAGGLLKLTTDSTIRVDFKEDKNA